MNVITIESEAFETIMSEFKSLKEEVVRFREKNQTPLGEKWLDNQEVCELLYISKRTLQSYRDNGLIPFSQVNAKIYYKASDISEYLNKHYNKAFKECA